LSATILALLENVNGPTAGRRAGRYKLWNAQDKMLVLIESGSHPHPNSAFEKAGRNSPAGYPASWVESRQSCLS